MSLSDKIVAAAVVIGLITVPESRWLIIVLQATSANKSRGPNHGCVQCYWSFQNVLLLKG